MSAAPTKSAKRVSFADPATFTPHFAWKKAKNGTARVEEIVCENVSLSAIAQKFETPVYIYSRSAILDAYDELDSGLGKVPHTLCFAVKSNGNLSILKELAKRGSGFDIVSGGELEHLRRIGVGGERIVFSGVGKTRREIREALNYSAARHGGRAGILLFNVESESELETLIEESARIVERGGEPTAASIRVNPDVHAGGHPHISTGRHEHKFGLDWGAAKRLYLTQRDSPFIKWQGLSAHIGSQIVSLAPFREAIGRMAGYVEELRKEEIELRYLDFGGGLGVRYANEKVASRAEYARAVAKAVRKLRMHLLLEPGRSIIAQAGILLTRVLHVKENRGKTFVIVDAAMNDLMRPALYGAVHPITRVARKRGDDSAQKERVDIVGPVCETGDCFLRDWPLGKVQAGDLLAVWVTGAYGMSQASNYNARCRPAEVLVEGNKFRVIRRRETQEDLLLTDVLG